MQLKIRQIILFILACTILFYSQMSGGALLALAVLMQLMILIQNIEFSRRSQIAVIKLYLFSLPLFFFWGGTRTFVSIYQSEQQLILFVMSSIITYFLGFLIVIQTIFTLNQLEGNEFNVTKSIQQSFVMTRKNLKYLFKAASLIFVFSFIPITGSDWKLVFAIMATHLSLNWNSVKKAIGIF